MPSESRLQQRHIPDPERITPLRLEAAYWSSLGKRLLLVSEGVECLERERSEASDRQ